MLQTIDSSTPLTSWTVLVNVIFGSVASISFRQFHETLILKASATKFYMTFRIYVFFCFFAFFVYDWAVWTRLMGESPYRLVISSVFRFVLDLMMGFLLLGLTWYAGRAEIEERPRVLIFYLVPWHVCAAGWHVLAAWQYGWNHILPQVLAWHLVIAPLTYAVAWGIARLGAYMFVDQSAPQFLFSRNQWIVGTLATAVLGVSVVRTLIAFSLI
jgi:hypothetical protein